MTHRVRRTMPLNSACGVHFDDGLAILNEAYLNLQPHGGETSQEIIISYIDITEGKAIKFQSNLMGVLLYVFFSSQDNAFVARTWISQGDATPEENALVLLVAETEEESREETLNIEFYGNGASPAQNLIDGIYQYAHNRYFERDTREIVSRIPGIGSLQTARASKDSLGFWFAGTYEQNSQVFKVYFNLDKNCSVATLQLTREIVVAGADSRYYVHEEYFEYLTEGLSSYRGTPGAVSLFIEMFKQISSTHYWHKKIQSPKIEADSIESLIDQMELAYDDTLFTSQECEEMKNQAKALKLPFTVLPSASSRT